MWKKLVAKRLNDISLNDVRKRKSFFLDKEFIVIRILFIYTVYVTM